MIIPNNEIRERRFHINRPLLRFLLRYGICFALVGTASGQIENAGYPVIRDQAICYDVENASINNMVSLGLDEENPPFPLQEEVAFTTIENVPEDSLPIAHQINIIDGEERIDDSFFSTHRYYFEIPLEESNYEEIVEALNSQDYQYFLDNYSEYITHNPRYGRGSGHEWEEDRLTYVAGNAYNIDEDEPHQGLESYEHNARVTYINGILTLILALGSYLMTDNQYVRRRNN